MVVIVPKGMGDLACTIVKDNKPTKITDTFEVYSVPPGNNFEHHVLLLFFEGKDFSPGQVSGKTIPIPVRVGKRQGYFLDPKTVPTFSS